MTHGEAGDVPLSHSGWISSPTTGHKWAPWVSDMFSEQQRLRSAVSRVAGTEVGGMWGGAPHDAAPPMLTAGGVSKRAVTETSSV